MYGRDGKENLGGKELMSVKKREHWQKEKKFQEIRGGQNMRCF